MLLENMQLIQNWLATKLARQNPRRNRTTINDVGDETNAVAKTTGAVRKERVEEATRGPRRSQTGPMKTREKMDPMKAAMPAVPTSVLVK
ncbi:hypothetical protein SLA2020_078330 [Shorea laevis]